MSGGKTKYFIGNKIKNNANENQLQAEYGFRIVETRELHFNANQCVLNISEFNLNFMRTLRKKTCNGFIKRKSSSRKERFSLKWSKLEFSVHNIFYGLS